MPEPGDRHDHPPLRRADLSANPIEQFGRWYEHARERVPLPDAMVLATAAPDGAADARMVLLKGFDTEGFRFFSNYESVKGTHLEANPQAAIVIYWRELDRQVRARGVVEQLDPVESGSYFQTRDRESRLGAWASPQSRTLENREELEDRFEKVRSRFEETEDVPRPEFWGGYLLRPERVEFWQGQRARLHDRFLYTRENGGWRIERLAP
jgi:pyridoxamine 5'-phosphate oxidase